MPATEYIIERTKLQVGRKQGDFGKLAESGYNLARFMPLNGEAQSF